MMTIIISTRRGLEVDHDDRLVAIDPLPGPVRAAATLAREEVVRMATRKTGKRATKKASPRKG
jgi:hypothetical protein